MRCPLTKSLLSLLPNLSREKANLIRKIAHATTDGPALASLIEAHCPATQASVRSSYGAPFASRMRRTEVALQAFDEILETHGVEGLGPMSDDGRSGPPYEYCNTGDTYAATLVYTRATDTLRIASWGDIAERHPSWP